ncbi:MAG TPA: DUF192 domain-containing protein [Caulobacteraceae bacterium]
MTATKTLLRVANRAMLAALTLLSVGGEATARSLTVEPLEVVTAHGVRHFSVEVADTPASREHGLMFRTQLAADRGMLFDFKTVQPVDFWMKDTLIPLDILFIAADGRIVSIARNATPMSEAHIPSGSPILEVLEVRGGRAAEIGAEVGDRVHPGQARR